MLTPGTRLGHYDVQTLIGQGGMGEVYRASDTRLKRDVAVKILPEAFAADTERLARFEREAQLLASLNHPHIAGIYGIEESNGVRAIVMELVEGPTLAERIAQGPIALDETLTIAAQIAEALDVAHSAGIIHRDLKPANIKLRPDGAVKVLDFGLAKGAPGGGSSVGSASVILNSPTITSPVMTMQGVILGTAAYMSPEQAKGKPVDKRADIWAFGVILYEMLTGARLYVGDDVSETLASILKSEPDWQRLPPDTPPTIRRLLKRCLAKDPKLRLHDAGDALLEIRDAMSGADDVSRLAEASPVTRVRQRLLFVASVVAAIAVGATAMWFLSRQGAAPAPTTRVTIMLPETDSLPAARGRVLAVSPDGKTIVYRANDDPGGKLFRRSLNQFDAAVLPNTEGGSEPFFSPDGQWVAFLAARDLKKVPLAGGAAETIVTQQLIRGARWMPDGRILYGTNEPNGRLMQVSAAGGEPTMLWRLSDDLRLWYPQVLNNDSDVLFTASEPSTNAGELRVVHLTTGEQRTIVPRAVAGRLLPTGHLVFVRDSALWAARFDSTRLEIMGEPLRVVPNVRIERGGAVQFDVANDGSLFYIAGGDPFEDRGVLVAGATGEAQPTPLPLRQYSSLTLSADKTRAAVQIGDIDTADVWVAELNRGTLGRITSESGYEGHPVWGPDQRHVTFGVARKARWSIQQKSADGTGAAETLATFDQNILSVRPFSWSADGTMLLFDYRTNMANDIGLLTMSDRKWRPLIASPIDEQAPAISPDGRWIAYHSMETGQAEVYVQRFPSLGDRQLVSVGGGHNAGWTDDGRSLMYLRGTPPTAVMRTTFKTTGDGNIVFSSPELFRPYSFFARPGLGRTYDVTRDGRRLVVIGTADAPATVQRQMNVITNWHEELKTLVPVR